MTGTKTHAPDPFTDTRSTNPVWTRCGQPPWAARIAATDEPVTCKTCLRLLGAPARSGGRG